MNPKVYVVVQSRGPITGVVGVFTTRKGARRHVDDALSMRQTNAERVDALTALPEVFRIEEHVLRSDD